LSHYFNGYNLIISKIPLQTYARFYNKKGKNIPQFDIDDYSCKPINLRKLLFKFFLGQILNIYELHSKIIISEI